MDLSDVIATGQLSERPLVELVRDIATAKLSGAVRLVRERVKSVLYFDTGDVIFAVSNLPQHRLTVCALEWGFASADQVNKVPAKKTEVEYGQALVAAGVLTPLRLEELFARLSTEVTRYILPWTDGDWAFDPRVRLAQSVRARIAVQNLLLEAVRNLPADVVAQRVTNHKRQIVPAPSVPTDIPLSSMESYVLSRVDSPMQVGTLLELAGLPESDLLRSVYALAIAGLLHGSLWPEALGQTQVSEAKKLTAQSQRTAAKAANPATRPAIPAQAPSSAGAPQQPNLPPPPASVASEPTTVEERRAADAYLLRVEGAKDHYDIMGILRAATDAEIKKAYYEIARRFHPDRFHQEKGTRMHEALQAAFAKVSHAYDTLRDPKLRAAHDKRFEAAASKGGFDPLTADPNAGTMQQQAEVRFQQGLAAIQNNNAKDAIILCAQAARMAPNDARFRAAYGQALALDPNKRHQAEAELKEAIKLDPKSANFLIVLAEFYSEMGHNRRAASEFQRALTLDPNNAIAKRRLAELQM